MRNYYIAFDYKKNLMGIGQKNSGATAGTAAVLIGQA
jgi:hypothetical protein